MNFKSLLKQLKSSAEILLLIIGLLSVFYGVAPEKIISEFSPVFSNIWFTYFSRIIGILLIVIFFYLRTKPKNSEAYIRSHYVDEKNATILLFNYLDHYPYKDDKGEYRHYSSYSKQYSYSGHDSNDVLDSIVVIQNVMKKIVKNDDLKKNLQWLLNLFKKKQLKQDRYDRDVFSSTSPTIISAVFSDKKEFLFKRKIIQKKVNKIIESFKTNAVN